jgi:ATP-dependent RNA helicase SUPV3L1/SUV3
MMEVGPGSEDNVLPATELPPRHDFSHVQGFQVVGAEGHGLAQADDQAWREALKLELEARAARLHQAVDAAIVLSNDGVIRWLGDPVAKLSLGPDVLNPSAVILADESLPVAARDTVRTRIELWIAATARRILAPLFALEAMHEGSEIVRDLARALVGALGVLEREPIKAKVKALAQDDRAELRKQGVRFGAYYIFVPALLKPGARALALQLWGLQAPGDANEFLSKLGSVASSGRTSLSFDNGISKEGYRVAGYRMCGDRIVRVDVLERLAGMIRAAFADEQPGDRGGGHRISKGFVVSGQMTSLTGCSGEHFASILRSMGFRPVEMKRSDFFGPPAPKETAGESESPPVAAEPASSGAEQASPPADEEEVTADAISAAPPIEQPPDAILEGAEAVAEDVGDVVAESAEGPPDDAGAERGDPFAADRATMPSAQDSPDGAHGADPGEQSVSPQTPLVGGDSAKNADVIVVWRPDRSGVAHNRRSESRRSSSRTPGYVDADGHSTVPGRKWARNKRKQAELPSPPATPAHPESTRPPQGADKPDSAKPEEKRRQRTRDYDMARANTPTAPQQKAKVDPNSPFAKLLELRPLLEEQANKRQ